MLNGVNLNYLVVLMVTGAVLLAAIYHTILFFHRETELLKRYSIYLWFTLLYCGYRLVFYYSLPDFERYINSDEMLQMIAFIMYITFAGVAFDLDKRKDRWAWFFVSKIAWVVAGYLVLQLVLVNLHFNYAYYISKGIIRIYLLATGFFMLLTVISKRKLAYYRYLAAGGVSMILCGLVSSIISMGNQNQYIFGALAWLMLGIFLDVIFFSSAIGYRIRTEYLEKEATLKALFEKESELKQKEFEKVDAIYKTREMERQRIARDLHDEVGATLTSISFLSEVVKQQYNNKHEGTLKTIDKIGEHSRKTIEEISDSVWAINPANDQFDKITDRMRNFAVPLLNSAGIQLDFLVEIQLSAISLNMDKRKNLYLVFKEALNNSVKYAGCSAVLVRLCLENDILQMIISDNGKGFNPASAGSGNGLNNMRARTAAVGALLDIRSSPGNGSTISVHLPVTQNA